MAHTEIIDILKDLLDTDAVLKLRLEQQLEKNQQDNPSTETNPVRSLNDLYDYAEQFLTTMPWQPCVETHVNASQNRADVFHRIDQKIGYFYYIFGDLQYEPLIANWIKQYNAAWGEFLDSPESWNNEYYEQIKQDPLFELDTDKYESPSNWHSWNDFFARRLVTNVSKRLNTQHLEMLPTIVTNVSKHLNSRTLGNVRHYTLNTDLIAEGIHHPWLPIKGNTLDIKTAKIHNITDLLGDSPEKQWFQNGQFTHITLDIFNYHRFHSPCDGEIVDIREIDGNLSAGGKIIWDNAENRYRYEQDNNIGFQMAEKRAVIIIEPRCVETHANSGQRFLTLHAARHITETHANSGQRFLTLHAARHIHMIALVPVGVAQVGSIRLNKDIRIGAQVHAGQELGYFQFGGSDIVIMESEN